MKVSVSANDAIYTGEFDTLQKALQAVLLAIPDDTKEMRVSAVSQKDSMRAHTAADIKRFPSHL